MRDLLYLVHRIPFPPNKGDKIRSFHILKHLARDYRVHLATFIDDPQDEKYIDDVRALCGETYFARMNPRAARVRSVRGLLTGEALSLPYYYDTGMQQWVSALLARKNIKHVVAFSSPMAQYARHVDSDVCRVMDFVDVDSDKWEQYARSKTWPLSWVYRRESQALLRYERAIAAQWDASILVSEDEAALLRRLAPESAARIHYAYNGVDADYFSPDRDYVDPYHGAGPALVFTGAMDYWANVDAVVWFANEVFPRVRAALSSARFFIVGSRPHAAVQALAQQPGVTVTGAVPDVRPYLHYAHAAVAPLRIARGIQNKVLEAMAMARPVLVTSAAAEGLLPCPNQALHVADDSEVFAQYALRALRGELPADAGRSGRACVLEHYGWESNLERLTALLERRSIGA